MEYVGEMIPIFTSMALLGLYHSPSKSRPATPTDRRMADDRTSDQLTVVHSEVSSNQKIHPISNGSKYYCFLTCIFTWFQFLRILPSYWIGIDYHENLLQTRILTTVYYLQCALNAVIMYRGCSRPHQVEEFFQISKEIYERYSFCVPSTQQVNKLKKRLRLILIFSWILNFVNCSVAALNFLELNDASRRYCYILTDPFGTSILNKVSSFLLYIFSSSAWMFPITLSCGLFFILCLRFGTLTKNLTMTISSSKYSFPTEVETYRQQHIILCACVQALDRMLKKLIMTSYVTNVPLMCFLMYGILFMRKVDVFELAAVIFWLAVNTLNVLSLSIGAAFVNEAAHSPADVLYKVNTAGATHEQLTQLQLFISRVTGTSIGFTTLGIVTVTKEMILTFGGILATYFTLLVQYQVN